MSTNIPIRTPLILTDTERIARHDDARIIAQSLRVLELRRIFEAHRGPLDRRDWLAARQVQDDLLDGAAARFRQMPPPCEQWPDPEPRDLITGYGPEGGGE